MVHDNKRAVADGILRSEVLRIGRELRVVIADAPADTEDAVAELEELAATIAVTRIVLGPKARVQAPPNLVDSEYALMLRAGIDDWGGVSPLTPDHVNPERPWPQIDDLAARTADSGFTLRERLTIYPEYVRRGESWLDPRLAGHVAALPLVVLAHVDEHGLAGLDPRTDVRQGIGRVLGPVARLGGEEREQTHEKEQRRPHGRVLGQEGRGARLPRDAAGPEGEVAWVRAAASIDGCGAGRA